MNIDVDQIALEAVHAAIKKAVGDKLSGYNSPLEQLVNNAVAENRAAIRKMIGDAIIAYTADADMQQEMNAAIKKKLATALVSKLGGELEKSVNELKADPTTRAKITIAINTIIEEKFQK